MFLIKIFNNYIMPVIPPRNELRRKSIAIRYINPKKRGATARSLKFLEILKTSKAVNKKRGKTKKKTPGRSPLYKSHSLSKHKSKSNSNSKLTSRNSKLTSRNSKSTSRNSKKVSVYKKKKLTRRNANSGF